MSRLSANMNYLLPLMRVHDGMTTVSDVSHDTRAVSVGRQCGKCVAALTVQTAEGASQVK